MWFHSTTPKPNNPINYTTTFDWPQGDALVAAGKTPNLVSDTKSLGTWIEHSMLQSRGTLTPEMFGSTIALDRTILAIAAGSQAAESRTSWTFDDGSLAGWTLTDTAFLTQPTYGDNINARRPSTDNEPVYGTPRFVSAPYWVSTYENYTRAAALAGQKAGSVQGNSPVGTMTSDSFQILGEYITFWIGGGCDARTEYVELLVDGRSVIRATGACQDRSYRVTWVTTKYIGRAGQIRIVDAARGEWGHITVDNFEFSWEVHSLEASPLAGTVTMFHLYVTGSLEPCTTLAMKCEWRYERTLSPSDKRSAMKFGHGLALDATTGVLLVTAPEHSPAWKTWSLPGSDFGAALSSFGSLHARSMKADGGTNTRQTNGKTLSMYKARVSPHLRCIGNELGGIAAECVDTRGMRRHHRQYGNRWNARNASLVTPPPDEDVLTIVRGQYHPTLSAYATEATRATGVVYVYQLIPEHRDGLARLISPATWSSQQHSILAVPSLRLGDRFATDVALSAWTAMVGSPQRWPDRLQHSRPGRVYMIDLEYQTVGFVSSRYTIQEYDHMGHVRLNVFRHGDLSTTLAVHYATRDITARGVSAAKWAACEKLAFHQRGRLDCGDYLHSAGEVSVDRRLRCRMSMLIKARTGWHPLRICVFDFARYLCHERTGSPGLTVHVCVAMIRLSFCPTKMTRQF